MRLIDADALLKEVENEQKYLIARGQLSEEHLLVHSLKRPVLDAPTVDAVERKKGKWVRIIDEVFADRFECSECGALPPIDNFEWWLSDYCPSCGADMRGENDG